MNLNTLFQTCIYFVMIILIFTLCINFVSFLDVFGEVDGGAEINLDNGSATFEGISGNPIGALWGAFTSAEGLATLLGLAGSVIVGALVRSPAVIGIGLFSTVFWASYLNMMGVLSIGGYIPLEFIAISHTLMLFLWAGATIGMLTGSG